MLKKKKGALEWLEYELLTDIPDLVHGVFLKHGGVSKSPYGSLNLGGGTGDETRAIAKNRKLVQETLGLSELISSMQAHKDHLEIVPTKSPALNKGCDGMMTQKKDLGLLIKHADCQSAIFYDPIRIAVANVHCGWRGSVKNIYGKTIDFMHEAFGSKPEDLLVCISPSLGPDHAEFVNHEKELPEHFLEFQVKKNHFDFWLIAKSQLMEKKVLENHIEIAKMCTFASGNDFFSYRREKNTGRNGTVVAIK